MKNSEGLQNINGNLGVETLKHQNIIKRISSLMIFFRNHSFYSEGPAKQLHLATNRNIKVFSQKHENIQNVLRQGFF